MEQWSFASGAVDLVKTQAKKVCKISENNCGAIMKVKVKKGDRGRPHQVLLTWSRGSENGKLAKKVVEQL